MFNDSVSFNGGTRVEVITVLANCGRDTDRARRALVTWIRHKQDKGRDTEHILAKLRDIESKFIKDTSLHSAFREARAETFLPKAPDLPVRSRKSENRTSESVPCVIAPMPNGARPSSISSSSVELPADSTQQTSPQTSPLDFSRNSSQTSKISPGKSNASRPISLPQAASYVPQSRLPRIQIPRDRSQQPGRTSPIASSPEESGLHLRYHHISAPVGPSSQSYGLVVPPSANPLKFPLSPSSCDQNSGLRGPSSHGLVSPVPSLQTQIPRSRSRRSFPNSPRTSSSEESDSRPGYSHIVRPIGPMSSGLCRVMPPRTNPPDVPLPPIPSDDQDVNSDSGTSKKSLPAEQPLTPVRSLALHPSTPVRILSMQPIPSPVPSLHESEHTGSISGNSLRQDWQESNGELLPLHDVVRQDSPVYVLHEDRAGQTGVSPPPPYVNQLDTFSPSDTPKIGDTLDRAVNVCGGSPEVRLEVSKCIEFHRGYEPPYWQTRLQACGLNAEAAKYLVDEMSKQVDWAASFGRAI